MGCPWLLWGRMSELGLETSAKVKHHNGVSHNSLEAIQSSTSICSARPRSRQREVDPGTIFYKLTLTRSGDIILLHHSSASKANSYTPSGYFLTPPTPTSGHKDVVRAIYHDEANAALYTGSEDGVLSGWSLSSLSSRLKVGDRELDDVDEEDEKREEDEDDEEEESEIETDDEDDEDGMDVDESEEREEGPKNGPIIGLADRRERKKERTKPY